MAVSVLLVDDHRLVREALRNALAKAPDIEVVDEAADVIYVCAGVQQIPITWIRALNPGGRLLLPLTPGNAEGGMLLVTSIGSERFDARFVASARFAP